MSHLAMWGRGTHTGPVPESEWGDPVTDEEDDHR